MRSAIAGGALILAVIGASIATGHPGAMKGEAEQAVKAAYEKYRALQDGSNASHIDVLAKADPKLFGIALVTVDGDVYTAGDVKSEVAIQGIGKVFTMARVLQDSGEAALRDNIGFEVTTPSSIATIEQHKQVNPLVNAGAIATTSMVRGDSAADVWKNISSTYDAFAGRHLVVDEDVYKAEAAANQRDQAIGMLMYAYEHIKANPLQAVDLYTRQSSVSANAVDLAVMAATLANGGKNPVTKKFIIDAQHVPAILAVMATAGLDDDSGKWFAASGLPAKSGAGGGLIAIAPGKFGIAVISPPLDHAGTSVRGQRVIADVAAAIAANPYYVMPK